MNMMNMNNSMGMNNQMNQNNAMGMNNQMTDEFSLRIKVILEPYEKKIKALEEQIRQKDFEIIVLKEKLYQAEKNSNNMNMPMGMGMGNPIGMQMGMGMGNPIEMQMGMGMAPSLINVKNNDSDIITIIFKADNFTLEQRCFIDDEFGSVQKKVLQKLNITGDIGFKFNGKRTNPKLTVSELEIENNSTVIIEKKNFSEISLKEKEEVSLNKMNIIFRTTHELKTSLALDKNISIGLAIKKFLMRIGKEELINDSDNKLFFIYNARRYKASDNIKLKDLFQNVNNPNIVINDVSNVIGA